MNDFSLNEMVEKLESVFLNILYQKPEEQLISPSSFHLADIKSVLNEIIEDGKCTDVLYTLNTDKQFFGIKVNPVITPTDALAIIASDDNIKLTNYQVELDSKLFDLGLTEDEIVALLLHDISSMINSYEIIDQLRAVFDLHVLGSEDVINIRDSVNYSQLIIFALKDTLYKLSSVLFKDEEALLQNKLILAAEKEESLLSAQEKVVSNEYGIGDSVRAPKTCILKWMFMVYKDMKHNSNMVKDTLLDAKEFAGSRLDKMEIDKTISAINRINVELVVEGVNLFPQLAQKGFQSMLEISLFKSLKQNGLRSIEDSYYEYAMRIKNCDTEEDAMYILHAINTRLSILDDYLYNTPDLSDSDRKRYELCANNYRQLREALAKKKIVNKKQYGLFYDYDAIYPGDPED